MQASDRIEICKKCPLWKDTPEGPVCNDKKYLDPITDKTSRFSRKGYIQGCGCRLRKAVLIEDHTCPVGKW